MHAGVHPLVQPDAEHLSFAVAISACKSHHVMLTTLCILYLKFRQMD